MRRTNKKEPATLWVQRGAKLEVFNEGLDISIGRLYLIAPFVSGFAFLRRFRNKASDFSEALSEGHTRHA